MPTLTTVSNTKAGIIATNGKLYFAKRHDRMGPWQIFTTQARAQAWLDVTTRPSMVQWN
jgi:hypothetical protein